MDVYRNSIDTLIRARRVIDGYILLQCVVHYGNLQFFKESEKGIVEPTR